MMTLCNGHKINSIKKTSAFYKEKISEHDATYRFFLQ